MKKTLAILLALCMLLGLVPAMAEVNLAGTYALDAAPLGMPMTVYLIVKEDNTFLLTNKLEGGAEKGAGMIGGEDGVYMMLYDGSTEEDFAVFGLDKATAMESFRQNDTYVLIFPGVYTHEIDLVMTENSIASFSELSEDTLNQSAALMDTVLSGMGCTVEKHDLYTVNGHRYIRTWYTAAGSEGLTYVMQYYTIENNKAVVYRMFAYTGSPISQDMETVLYDLVANVQYD